MYYLPAKRLIKIMQQRQWSKSFVFFQVFLSLEANLCKKVLQSISSGKFTRITKCLTWLWVKNELLYQCYVKHGLPGKAKSELRVRNESKSGAGELLENISLYTLPSFWEQCTQRLHVFTKNHMSIHTAFVVNLEATTMYCTQHS